MAVMATKENPILQTDEDRNDEMNQSMMSTNTNNHESSVLCSDHGMPLNFWQEKEQAYACIKCLIDEEEVHFVDKSYYMSLEKFKQIKLMTEKVVEENKGMPHTIADWKDDIRDMLLRVREQLNQFIDMFTHKFIR